MRSHGKTAANFLRSLQGCLQGTCLLDEGLPSNSVTLHYNKIRLLGPVFPKFCGTSSSCLFDWEFEGWNV